MRFRDLLAHEWRTRLSRPASLLLLALYAAGLTYGAVSGRMQRDARVRAIAAHRAEVDSAMARWLADRRALESHRPASVPPWAASAMDVTFATYLPPLPLADLAIGQSDLLPQLGAVSLWNPDIRLLSRYEIQDPVSLSLGAFDLSKGILLLLPLLLIVLCFDVLSADRDANRLGIILAQGVGPRALFWPRLLIRAGVALGITSLVSLAAVLAPSDAVSIAERLPPFAVWAAGTLLHGLFWVALVAVVSATSRRGEIQVLWLVLAWAGFNLILPASVTSIAEAAFPPPSRLAYLAQARETEISAERAEADIADGYLNDHPEVVIQQAGEVPAYVRTAFLVTRAVDEATRPILAAFDRSAAERDRMLRLLRFVSPAIVMHGLASEIAGSSSARHRRHVGAARALKAAYAEKAGPWIVAGERLPLAEVASLPVFRVDNEPAGAALGRHGGALLFLGAAAAVLFLLADRRVRRIAGPGDLVLASRRRSWAKASG